MAYLPYILIIVFTGLMLSNAIVMFVNKQKARSRGEPYYPKYSKKTWIFTACTTAVIILILVIFALVTGIPISSLFK